MILRLAVLIELLLVTEGQTDNDSIHSTSKVKTVRNIQVNEQTLTFLAAQWTAQERPTGTCLEPHHYHPEISTMQFPRQFLFKGKEKRSIYIASFILCIVSKHSDMEHTALPSNYIMPAIPS